MSHKETYKWDPEEGSAIVKIENKDGYIFMGSAHCHPDDKEHMSEHIGLEIAEIRARLNMLRHIRDNETIPALRAMEHVFSNMKTSKQFNPKSYEARMVRRQVNILKGDLAAIKSMISHYKSYIKELSESAISIKEIKDKIQMDKNE